MSRDVNSNCSFPLEDLPSGEVLFSYAGGGERWGEGEGRGLLTDREVLLEDRSLLLTRSMSLLSSESLVRSGSSKSLLRSESLVCFCAAVKLVSCCLKLPVRLPVAVWLGWMSLVSSKSSSGRSSSLKTDCSYAGGGESSFSLVFLELSKNPEDVASVTWSLFTSVSSIPVQLSVSDVRRSLVWVSFSSFLRLT